VNRRGKSIGLALAALLALAIAGVTHTAAPVRDKVLDDVRVETRDHHTVLDVRFSFPLRYVSHFPLDSGKELRVRLHPVVVPASDLDALFRREAVAPRYASTIAVDEVVYEGDMDGGPYLTVYFTHDVSYQVIPSPDYRGLLIIVTAINKANGQPEQKH